MANCSSVASSFVSCRRTFQSLPSPEKRSLSQGINPPPPSKHVLHLGVADWIMTHQHSRAPHRHPSNENTLLLTSSVFQRRKPHIFSGKIKTLRNIMSGLGPAMSALTAFSCTILIRTTGTRLSDATMYCATRHSSSIHSTVSTHYDTEGSRYTCR